MASCILTTNSERKDNEGEGNTKMIERLKFKVKREDGMESGRSKVKEGRDWRAKVRVRESKGLG
jgi:hypothetical protein